jgi:hypothetical protein
MVRSVFVLASVATLALPSAAQSIHVDFGPAGGPVPSPAYGASNGKAGVWNKVSTITPTNLVAWDGSPTKVITYCAGNPPPCLGGTEYFTAADFGGTSGDEAVIFDDFFSGGDWNSNDFQWVFEGLEPGDYDVDTIVVKSNCTWDSTVVAISTSVQSWTDPRVAWGFPGSFVEGVNFVRHHITTGNGRIVLTVWPNNVYADMTLSVAAIQLDKVGDDRAFLGTPLCFGDASSASCPCANSGKTGVGCQNSASTGGSWLCATGDASADTVVLHVAGELSSALSVFLQGNSVVGPFVYGDGLRCAGGTLRRLYSKHASNGVVAAPMSGDPSIKTRSSDLGVPISPGGRRYYQVFYRDPNATFCPQGGTFNVSNAVKIDW